MRKLSYLTRDQLSTLQDSYANEPLQAVLTAGTVGSGLTMARSAIPDSFRVSKVIGHKAALPVAVLAGAGYGWKKAREQNESMSNLVKTLKGKSDKETARNKLLNELEDKEFSPTSAAMQGAMAVPVLEVLPEAVSAIRKAKDYSFRGIGKGLASAVGPSLPVVAAASAIAAGAGATLRQREEREAIRTLEKRAERMNNRYLEKISETAKAKKDNSDKWVRDVSLGLTVGELGRAAGAVALYPVSMAFSRQGDIASALNDDTTDISDDTVKKYIENNKLEVDFNDPEYKRFSTGSAIPRGGRRTYSRFTQDAVAAQMKSGQSGPYVHHKNNITDFDTDYVSMSHIPKGSKSPSVSKNKAALLHELGHSKDQVYINKSKLRKLLLDNGRLASRAGGLIGGGMYLHEDTSDYAPVAVAAGHIPTLRSEYVASKSAYDAIKAAHGKEVARKHLKRTLWPAGRTYLGNAGLAVGATAVGSIALKKVRNMLDEE